MKFGYECVSTFEQKFESQNEVLREARSEEVFQEKFTGTTEERVQFNQALKKWFIQSRNQTIDKGY